MGIYLYMCVVCMGRREEKGKRREDGVCISCVEALTCAQQFASKFNGTAQLELMGEGQKQIRGGGGGGGIPTHVYPHRVSHLRPNWGRDWLWNSPLQFHLHLDINLSHFRYLPCWCHQKWLLTVTIPPPSYSSLFIFILIIAHCLN